MEDDATKDLAEFALANAVYAVLVEGHAAEINSRSVKIRRQMITGIPDPRFRILYFLSNTGETLWTMPPRSVPMKGPLLLLTTD